MLYFACLWLGLVASPSHSRLITEQISEVFLAAPRFEVAYGRLPKFKAKLVTSLYLRGRGFSCMLEFIWETPTHAHLKLDRQRADVDHHKQVPFRLLKCNDKFSVGNDDLGIELKVYLLYTGCI